MFNLLMIYAIKILEKKLYKYVVYFIGLLISYCVLLFFNLFLSVKIF